MASWKTFRPANGPKNVALFIKMSRAESSYTVHLTDLTHIWAERLERKALMRRAMDENTSIDPTNGPDQCRHLLDHIEKCLQAAPGTRVEINADSKKEAIHVTLTSELPAPLESLRWPLVLALEGELSFSSELLRPALSSLQDYRIGLRGLISVIKEKDAVIQRLQDKLEVTGVGLEAIFPGFGSLGSTNDIRAACQRKYPALNEFDYQKWVRGSLGVERDPCSHDVLSNISGSVGHNPESWWTHLSAEATKTEDCVPDSQHRLPLAPPSTTDLASPKRNRSASSTSTAEAESITSSNELIPESVEVRNDHVSTNQSDKIEESRKLTSRIGKLGGKKMLDEPRAPDVADTPTSVENQYPVSLPKRGPKLGKIGGARPDAVNSNGAQANGAAPTSFEIKNEPSQEINHKAAADHWPGRVRETSEERADRRRADLKRQLEEKKTAHGTKKKQRKF